MAESKSNYVGAPGIFALEQCCQQINKAFGDAGYGCFLVGSALDRADRRDVDVRFIMDDEQFKVLFPDAHDWGALWEHDPRWLLLTVSLSHWMSHATGLPVDFQFQPHTFANEKHDKPRHALGMTVSKGASHAR